MVRSVAQECLGSPSSAVTAFLFHSLVIPGGVGGEGRVSPLPKTVASPMVIGSGSFSERTVTFVLVR